MSTSFSAPFMPVFSLLPIIDMINSDGDDSYNSDIIRTLPLYYEQEEILLPAPNFNNLLPIVCHVPQLSSTPEQESSCLPNLISYYNSSIHPNRLISPFVSQTSVSLFYESDNSCNFSDGWYPTYGDKIKEYQFNENNSDADTENTHFQEEEAKLDPRGHILTRFTEGSNYDHIVDIFDYYFGEQLLPKDTYNIGDLEGE
ncbi:20413_t:CDS:2 [Gigaspora rosea]|nr:20413_t:CDS:2 [Gigaspora rosea]